MTEFFSGGRSDEWSRSFVRQQLHDGVVHSSFKHVGRGFYTPGKLLRPGVACIGMRQSPQPAHALFRGLRSAESGRQFSFGNSAQIRQWRRWKLTGYRIGKAIFVILSMSAGARTE